MLVFARSILPEGRSSRVLAVSAALGVAIGVATAVFEYVTVEVVLHSVEELPLAMQAIAPIFGLAIAALVLRTLGNGASNATSDEYITAYHQRTPELPPKLLLPRMLAGVATIGSGGALGLEGPSIYTGSVFGLSFHRRLSEWLGRDAAKLLLTAGAAAGVAAIFQAPATGVLFALEAPYRDDVAHRALLPALLAAAASYLTFVAMPWIEPESFLPAVFASSEIGTAELVGAVAIGLGAGFGGRVYAWLIRRAKTISKSRSPVELVVIGGVLLGGLAVASDQLFEAPLTLGPGFGVIEWLSEPDRALMLIITLFLFRAAATMVTVGAGGTGGLFIPLAVQGVLLGRVVSEVLDQTGFDTSSARLWPVLGLAAFIAAGYRTPIAAVMFVAESTRGAAVVPALIAAAVSQLVAGRSSVSAGQAVERLGHLEERFTMPLAAALTTDVLTVPPDASLSEFVWIHALGRRVRVVPVVDGSTYLGLCTVEACTAIERDRWESVTVGEILDSNAPTASPNWSLRDAVAAMEHSGHDMLAVTDNDDTFIGVVVESEIVKLGEILDETGGSLDQSS
jgi:CIC family chloride channel protein